MTDTFFISEWDLYDYDNIGVCSFDRGERTQLMMKILAVKDSRRQARIIVYCDDTNSQNLWSRVIPSCYIRNSLSNLERVIDHQIILESKSQSYPLFIVIDLQREMELPLSLPLNNLYWIFGVESHGKRLSLDNNKKVVTVLGRQICGDALHRCISLEQRYLVYVDNEKRYCILPKENPVSLGHQDFFRLRRAFSNSLNRW